MAWPIAAFSLAAALAGDLATKALATRELGSGRVVELPLGVRLEHGENSGIAFGLLSGSGGLVLVVALIGTLALGAILLRPLAAAAAVPIAVLFGGALANLVDRAGDGAVTDFIDLGPWPAFNLADVAITAGVALLAIALARDPTSGALEGAPTGARRPGRHGQDGDLRGARRRDRRPGGS